MEQIRSSGRLVSTTEDSPYGFVLQPMVKLLAKCRKNEGVESGKLKVAYLAVDVSVDVRCCSSTTGVDESRGGQSPEADRTRII